MAGYFLMAWLGGLSKLFGFQAGRGREKITAGIIDLWRPSVYSRIAFFDDCLCCHHGEAELIKHWIVHQ